MQRPVRMMIDEFHIGMGRQKEAAGLTVMGLNDLLSMRRLCAVDARCRCAASVLGGCLGCRCHGA